MDEAGRRRYRGDALSLAKELAGAETDENVVWAVYAGTEKLIAILKFRIDYETPGVFTKLPDASDSAKLLNEARRLLSRAAEEIAGGRLVASIGTLRKARNDLRSYLTERRKSATRAGSGAGAVAARPEDAATEQ